MTNATAIPAPTPFTGVSFTISLEITSDRILEKFFAPLDDELGLTPTADQWNQRAELIGSQINPEGVVGLTKTLASILNGTATDLEVECFFASCQPKVLDIEAGLTHDRSVHEQRTDSADFLARCEERIEEGELERKLEELGLTDTVNEMARSIAAAVASPAQAERGGLIALGSGPD